MFLRDRTDESRPLLWTTIGTLISIVVAIVVTGWLIYEIRSEQVAVEDMMRRGAPRLAGSLRFLSGELRWQLPLTVVVLFNLVLTAITFLFVARAYLTSQHTLRETKALAWDILASIDRGIITADREGIITSVNPEGSKLLELEESCLGRPLETICRSGNPLAAICRRVLVLGVAEYDCDFVLHRGGHELRLRADCNVLRSPSGSVAGIVLHLRDVTERILIEEQVRRMERFMGLGTLAASLHHEIKNPLSALSLHVQLLEERLAGSTDSEARETLHILETEIARINGVLDSFRDYASVDKLNREKTDVCSLMRRIVDLIRPQAEQQGIQIKLEIPGEERPQILADGARLEQVALNLVLNGLEAMADGGRLRLEVAVEGHHVRLTVADTGTGIPPSFRQRIFDPYFTTKPRGSGMGLAFCDKIIREHGGQISFETSSSGTEFNIYLPYPPG